MAAFHGTEIRCRTEFWFDGYSAPNPPIQPPGPPPPGPTPPGWWWRAPNGNQGMTINDGAQYTNDPDVMLSVIGRPAGSDCSGPTTAASAPQDIPGRKVDPLASRRVRPRAPAQDGLPALRATRPELHRRHHPRPDQADRQLGGRRRRRGAAASSATVAQAAAAETATYRVRIRAKDATSGVAKVQFARNKRHPSSLHKFARTSLQGGSAPKYLRVQDRAGNFSRWRSVR